mgnify:CR=1 FL=1
MFRGKQVKKKLISGGLHRLGNPPPHWAVDHTRNPAERVGRAYGFGQNLPSLRGRLAVSGPVQVLRWILRQPMRAAHAARVPPPRNETPGTQARNMRGKAPRGNR